MSRKADVCMIVKNQLWNDARVKKEASSLAGMGLKVTVLSQPEDGYPAEEDRGGIHIVRVPPSGNLKSSMRRILDSSQGSGNTPGSRFVATLRRNPVKRFIGELLHSTIYQGRLFRHALACDARTYHAHDLDTLPAAAAAAWVNSAALVYDSHELWLGSRRHLSETSGPFRYLERFSESLLAPLADAVIAVTPGRARLMRDMYPTMAVPDLVVNYPPLAEVSPRNMEVRKRLGAEDDSVFLVLYQGILGLHRGLEELLDASLLLRGTGVHIAFVGHDRSGGAITSYAREIDAGDMVTFHPPVPSEELPEITGSADAGLLLFQGSCPNHTYSLPNKLFEYMMSGLPIVACDLPEISHVIRQHDCGRLVDSSDPGSIALGIRTMASDPEGAAAMGTRGLRAAEREYTWSRAEEVLSAIYSRFTGSDRCNGPADGGNR